MPTTLEKPKIRLPKKELRTWLRGRQSWNHDDWLALLQQLRGLGFGEWADVDERCDEIGSYLEKNRKIM